jgi:mannitol 2-dehydrogenase
MAIRRSYERPVDEERTGQPTGTGRSAESATGTRDTGARSMPLRGDTLASLAEHVPIPAYDRDHIVAGVVHLGVGGFHRAHLAMYHDRLLSEQQALDWGICGVGVLPADAGMKAVLDAQDGLYTLVEKGSDGARNARVIGSIVRYLLAPEDPEAVIEAMADPDIRIVSLTITEGGYNLDPDTGEFDAADPDVARDLEHPEAPRTAFGLVVEALRRRRDRGVAPFTVMSCDNLPGNGRQAREAFTAFARLRDPALGAWVHDVVAFPNSMVDRITPVTTDADRAEVRAHFGIDDRWPVVCEPFAQWVLEDVFPAGRPPYEEVGVQLVASVEPYELMKLRLLNAGHQALGYFGYLCGHRFVHEAAQDPLLRSFLLGYLEEEGIPTVPEVPGIDLRDYGRSLIVRFSNGHVPDTLARVCAYSSDRIPKFLVPVVRAALASGGEMRRAAAVIASWARYAEGVDEHGQPIEIVDRLAPGLTDVARRQREAPDAFIAQRRLFGDLVDQPRFRDAYTWALQSLHERGARSTLEAIVEPEARP